MKYIACIDRMGGLGYKGKLLFHIREDMKRFRKLTDGGVVVMGYNTYKSLPHGALPNRLNIVLTRHHKVEEAGVVTVGSRDELYAYLHSQGLNPDDVWIIGGAKVYVDFLPDCKEMYITRVESIEESDCFFPCPEVISGWELHEAEYGGCTENGLDFVFEHHVRS